GPATTEALSAYFTAAFAFKPANSASTSRAPAKTSRHPSAEPANGSATENGSNPDPSTSAFNTARAARMSA
ncbi:MAG TPA: hypothetical protein VGE95_03100, partial [Arthrobacter sp.]